ncbi:MAG: MFS transporter [Candidatus Pacebacteria bacterium]|nr:MFS transporter [Candidatus Paceibacterota bacterium]
MNTKKIEGNIWKSYIFQILCGLFFSVPVMVLFWQDNGLSLMEIMILQSLFSITVVLLEVPTGYFADVFGRRKALIYASFFSFFGFLIYGLSYNFYQFLIAEIFLAFAISFTSGADSALLYDTLKDLKKEDLYKKIWGNILSYGLVSIAFASIIGGFVGKIDLRWTIYLSIPFLALLIPLSFSLKEPKRHKTIFKEGYLFELFKTIKYTIIKNRKLKWLIVYSGVLLGFNSAALWFYQPYFKISGLDIAYFGIVFACFNVIAAISSKYAHKIEAAVGQKFSLISLVLITGISYLLMSNFIYIFSFSFAFLQQFVRGFSKPIIEDYINKLTSSEIRATVLSVQNMSSRFFYAAVIPIIGWIADIYSLVQALTILGITTLVFGTVMIIILRKVRVI